MQHIITASSHVANTTQIHLRHDSRSLSLSLYIYISTCFVESPCEPIPTWEPHHLLSRYPGVVLVWKLHENIRTLGDKAASTTDTSVTPNLVKPSDSFQLQASLKVARHISSQGQALASDPQASKAQTCGNWTSYKLQNKDNKAGWNWTCL